MSDLTHVPLSELSIDEKVNARTTGRGAEPEFAASIRAVGIIEPLIVRQPNGKGHYTVTNGSKRFDALMFLRDHKESAQGIAVTDAYPVPVVIRAETDTQARETSLMTHVIRSDLHPVEEFRAFSGYYADVRKQKLPHEDAVMTIARRFGISAKYVEQSLALANLDDAVLDAWVKGEIEQDAAQAFTLCPDKKSQAAIFAKLQKQSRGSIDRSDVKNALRIAHGNPGRLLNTIGIEAYEKRGGKVTRDLFGADHVVSNEKLAKAMSIEAVAAKCDALVKEGWAWAIPADDVQNRHAYGQVGIKARPTPEEDAKLAQLRDIIDDYGADDDDQENASAEYDALQAAIDARAFTAEQKAKSGCFVDINHLGNLTVDAGKTKPEERKAVQAQERKAEKKKAAKSGKAPEPAAMSAALTQRLSEQLTKAAAEAVKAEPALGLTFTLAALLASGGRFGAARDAICISNNGMLADESKSLSFKAAYDRASKMKPAEQLKLLAEIIGTAFSFVVYRPEQAPLIKGGDAKLVCDEIDAKAMNASLRKTFDAADYFGNVAKAVVLKAITEAVNADEARKVSGKPKGEIAKFATANVPKTGWLPPELRTAHYDGPTGKAKTTAKKKR